MEQILEKLNKALEDEKRALITQYDTYWQLCSGPNGAAIACTFKTFKEQEWKLLKRLEKTITFGFNAMPSMKSSDPTPPPSAPHEPVDPNKLLRIMMDGEKTDTTTTALSDNNSVDPALPNQQQLSAFDCFYAPSSFVPCASGCDTTGLVSGFDFSSLDLATLLAIEQNLRQVVISRRKATRVTRFGSLPTNTDTPLLLGKPPCAFMAEEEARGSCSGGGDQSQDTRENSAAAELVNWPSVPVPVGPEFLLNSGGENNPQLSVPQQAVFSVPPTSSSPTLGSDPLQNMACASMPRADLLFGEGNKYLHFPQQLDSAFVYSARAFCSLSMLNAVLAIPAYISSQDATAQPLPVPTDAFISHPITSSHSTSTEIHSPGIPPISSTSSLCDPQQANTPGSSELMLVVQQTESLRSVLLRILGTVVATFPYALPHIRAAYPPPAPFPLVCHPNQQQPQEQHPILNGKNLQQDGRDSLFVQTSQPESHTTPQSQTSQVTTLADFTVLCKLYVGGDQYQLNETEPNSDLWGDLHLCQHITSGRHFCMKIWKLSTSPIGPNASLRAEKWRESQLMSPFLAKLSSRFYTFDDGVHLYFLMEFTPGSDLYSYIKQGLYIGNEDYARFTLGEIALGLEQLHAANMVYCDLVPENIFLDDKGHAKLMHFPLLKYMPSCTILSNKKGFLGRIAEYVAPELLQTCRQKTGKALDWWCFGCLMCEMLTGTPPFAAESDAVVYARILCGEVVLCCGFTSVALSFHAQDIIRKLLACDPEKRLGSPETGGFEAIKRHPFFASINWSALATGSAQCPWPHEMLLLQHRTLFPPPMVMSLPPASTPTAANPMSVPIPDQTVAIPFDGPFPTDSIGINTTQGLVITTTVPPPPQPQPPPPLPQPPLTAMSPPPLTPYTSPPSPLPEPKSMIASPTTPLF
ncbi:camp-dependent protein kinase catalytic subunit family protein [Pelomyxa schiedti]|nr:camp-dependent protein kinase catalytic subunit family protein [Pelomyxa schiedti]